MLRRIVGVLLGLVGIIALAVVGGYFALKRPDIPYETLAAKYESSASRYVELPGGVRMHFRDEGNRSGPAVLLVHGFSASLHTWEPWVDQLGDDFRLISIDLPGHGLTRAPAGYQPSIENFANEIAAFAQSQNLTRFAIIGSSMGGNTAWEYTLAHPDQVSALVLVDSSGWEAAPSERDGAPLVFRLLRHPLLGPLLRDIDSTRLTRQALQTSFSNQALVDDAMVSRYVELSRAPGHRDILIQISTTPRQVATPERLAPLSAKPVLILHGTRDNLVPVAHAQAFNNAIAGSQIALLDGVGHLPQEESPDISAAAVRDFLDHALFGPALVTAAE